MDYTLVSMLDKLRIKKNIFRNVAKRTTAVGIHFRLLLFVLKMKYFHCGDDRGWLPLRNQQKKRMLHGCFVTRVTDQGFD